MGHQHTHHHNCSHGHHHHADKGISFAFWLNLIFAIIELVGGLYVNSMAVISDSVHDFGDALSLGIAWVLEKKSQKKGDLRYSYGYRRYSTFSALLTAVVLLTGSILVLVESIPRLLNPVQPETKGMIVLALLGVIVNGMAFLRLKKGTSLNERVLSWHFIEDLLGWSLILVSAVIMNFVQLPMLDSIMAILISIFIFRNVWKGLSETASVFLQATPEGLNLNEVKQDMVKKFNLADIHHMHLWSLDGEKHILTAHFVLKNETPIGQQAELKREIKKYLNQTYKIYEATIELEVKGEICLDPSHT